MATNDMEIVRTLRQALAEQVGQDRYDLWLGKNVRIELDGHRLTISVPSRFYFDWIRSKLQGQIESACRKVLGERTTLKFQVDTSLSAADDERTDVEGAGDNGSSSNSPASTKQRQHTRRQRHRSSGDMPRRKYATLGSFVSGPGNQFALASADRVARQPGKMTPLLVHGPTSVGKTHLLEGILSTVRRLHRNTTAIYLSAEQFTTQFLEALRGSGLPNFRRKCRGADLLIIDDLQFFAGKRATQVELLHTIDDLMRDQRQLVFSADNGPSELPELAPELTTRLASGLVCGIEPPGYATRLGIVTQMALRLDIKVPDDVKQFIASRLTNHTRELSGALCRLQVTSEAFQKPITMKLAEESLAELIRHSGPVVRLPDIERAVCDVFGLQPASLQSGGKTKRVSHPRMLAMWLARKHTRAALSEIGNFFGRRSHSTVVSAQRRIDGWMADGQPLSLAEGTYDVDEAIRQVERRFRAG